MLTNFNPYRLKTLLLGIQLCITLLFCHAQVNNSPETLVSDTTNSIIPGKVTFKERLDKLKIPIYKKGGEKRIWAFPSVAWNNYDKSQVGIMLVAEKSDKYSVLAMPMYGTGSKNLTGIFRSELKFSSKQSPFKGSVGINAKRFSYLLFPEDLAYNKLSPFINFEPKFKGKGRLSFHFQHQSIWQEYILQGRKTQYFYLNTIAAKHLLENDHLGVQTEADLLIGKAFASFTIASDLVLKYKSKAGNAFYLRAFAGSFLYNNRLNTNIDAPLPVFQLTGSTNNGIYWLQKDYAFKDFYFDRNGQDNFFKRQQAPSEGGFRSLSSAGNSNSVLVALNLKSDVLLPYKVKKKANLQPFLNIALAKNRDAKAELYAEGGLSLVFFCEILSFHIPFVSTNNIKLNQSTAYGIDKGDWTKRITFSFDLMALKRKFEAEEQ